MTRRDAILARLIRVVQLLGNFSDEFIFVGGSIVPILVTDEAAPDSRPTVDVDVIVQVFTRLEYYKIEKRLAEVGFHLDIFESVICRFKCADIILDVMPMDEEILKFGNQWYKQAAGNHIVYPLLTERAIKVINAPLFICTKFDAYKSRGHKDEKDLEDIIAIVDGRRELANELSRSSKEISKYISDCTRQLLDNNLESRLNWFLPTDAAGAAREVLVLERLKIIATLKNL